MPALDWDLAEVIQDSDKPQGVSKADRRLLLESANKNLLQEKTSFSSATAAAFPYKRSKPRSKLNPSALEGTKPDANHKNGVGNGSLTSEMNGSGTEGEGASPPPPRVLFPKERLQMTWDYCLLRDEGKTWRVTRPGAGLYNPSQLCYMNSAINCLTYTAPLTNYLLSFEHRNTCKFGRDNRNFLKGSRREKGCPHSQSDAKAKMSDRVCIMCTMTNQVVDCLRSPGKTIRPLLHDHLKRVCQHFKTDSQEDAQEYMLHLLNILDSDFLRNYGKVDPQTARTSVINQIFAGITETQVVCCRCNKKSSTKTLMREMLVDIRTCTSLKEGMEKYFSPTTLEGENAYHCERCKLHTKAKKSETVLEPPNILTVMLNRFGDPQRASKLQRNIRVEGQFDMRRYMSNKKGDPIIYQLYAMMVHYGNNTNGGHYISYCKGPDRRWYQFDDTHVTEVTQDQVLSNGQGYIVFYQRKTVPSMSNGPSKEPGNNNHLNHQNKPKVINGFHGDPAKIGANTNGKRKNYLGGLKVRPHFGGLAELSNKVAAMEPSTSKATALPEKREKVAFSMHPSVILKIQHGTSSTLEKGPDGQSMVVPSIGATSQSGLVPYDEDSDSEVENGGRENGSRENGREKSQVPKHSPSPALPSTSSSSSSSRPPIVDGELNATTSVPGNGNLHKLDKGFRGFDSLSHTRPAAAASAKRSQSCERILSKLKPNHKGTNSAGNSPRFTSLREASSLLKTSRTPSHERDGEAASDYPEKKPSVDSQDVASLAQAATRTSKTLPEPIVSTHFGWERSPATLTADASGAWSTQRGSGDASQGAKSPKKAGHNGHSLHQHAPPSAGGDDKSGPSSDPTMKTDSISSQPEGATPNGHCSRNGRSTSPDFPRTNHHSFAVARDSHIPASSHSHASSSRASIYEGRSPVDVSDRRPLLEDCEMSSPTKSKKHKKHKKHKKRRYLEEGAEDAALELHSNHKKHKKRKHKHKDHRDRGESGHHHGLHNGNDSHSDSSHRGKKSTQSSESEEYEWVERTKDSLISKLPSLDQKDVKSKCPPLTDVQKTAKEESMGVVDELERNRDLGYGKRVFSWEGGLSGLSQDKEHQAGRKRLWEEDYEDELDRGKTKKYKKHYNEKSYHQRSFNPFQRAQEERAHGEKHHSSIRGPSSFPSHSDDGHQPSSYPNQNGDDHRPSHPKHGGESHRASSHPSDRRSIPGLLSDRHGFAGRPFDRHSASGHSSDRHGTSGHSSDRHSVTGLSSGSFYGRRDSVSNFFQRLPPWRKAN